MAARKIRTTRKTPRKPRAPKTPKVPVNQPHRGHQQGYFTPRHPEKYRGDVNKIRYMSSWELSFNHFLDNNPNILAWASEEIKIPYLKPTTNRIHHYYPDYWIKYKDKNGNIVQEVIEVKPEKETKPPKTVGKSKKTQLYEQLTWAVNTAKWEAATQFCAKYNMKFRILTEKQLFK